MYCKQEWCRETSVSISSESCPGVISFMVDLLYLPSVTYQFNWGFLWCLIKCLLGFAGDSLVKDLPAMQRPEVDTGSISSSRRSPGAGNGSPLQYSCLGNPVDREAWRVTVHGVAKELDMSEQLNNNSVDKSWEFWEQWIRCPTSNWALREWQNLWQNWQCESLWTKYRAQWSWK